MFILSRKNGLTSNRRSADFREEAMKKSPGAVVRPSRRDIVKGSLMAAGTAAFFGPWRHNRVWAQGAKKPIRLGLTCDASGQYGNSGQDDMRGIRLAIDEYNAKGGVLGRKIEWITADTETNPATGTRVAERFIAQDQCGFLIGAVHSGVANAITQVANKYGTIYFNTNSSAPSEAGENCSRVKFVWDGNGTNFSKASVQNAVEKIGKRWLLLTNDYVWGHTTSASTKVEIEKAGGQILDNLLVPQNTRDFTSYLLKVQQAKPDVVAMAIGGDDMKALRQQISSLKLEERTAWINNQQDWPDIWGAADTLFGVFGTNWYHLLPLPGVAELVKRWQTAYPQSPIPVPGNVSYNGYVSTRELFRAIERAGSTNNAAVIKQLEGHKMPAADRMQHFDAYIDPVTHQVQQTIYLARRNAKPKDQTDLFEIISWTKPETALDDDAPKKCKMKPLAELPSFEP
jgi:branched-chain amino acid transport system substrate-binding protein